MKHNHVYVKLPRQLDQTLVQAFQLAISWLNWSQHPDAVISHLGLYYTGVKPEGISSIHFCHFGFAGYPVVWFDTAWLPENDPRRTYDERQYFLDADAVDTLRYIIETAGGDIQDCWNGIDCTSVSFALHNQQGSGAIRLRNNYSRACAKTKEGLSVFCGCEEHRLRYALAVKPEHWN